MDLPYLIRLRGFWVVDPLPDGRTRHRRACGRPRVLGPGETAWLVGDGVPGPADVRLNGEVVCRVSAAGPFAADVTDRLRHRNEVAVDVAAAADAPLGVVGLELRAGAARP